MQYSSKLKAIWREIDYLWPTQNPQSDEREYILMQRLFAFLNGLNDVYENVRSQLLHWEKLPSLEEAIGAIKQPESRLRVTTEPQRQNSAALLTKRPENRVLPGGSRTPRSPQSNSVPAIEGDDNRDSLFSTYCKKHRHTNENYWKLAWKNQNLSKKAYATSTQAQSSQIAVTSPQVEEVQERLSFTALVKSGNSSIPEWIADTGATDHMSPTEHLFRNYSPTGIRHQVQTAGGGKLLVKGVGDILLSPLGVLKEVLYVEDLRANLISIQKLVEDHG